MSDCQSRFWSDFPAIALAIAAYMSVYQLRFWRPGKVGAVGDVGKETVTPTETPPPVELVVPSWVVLPFPILPPTEILPVF